MKTDVYDEYEPEIHEEIGMARQCGARVTDVPYLCCGRSIFGMPIEYFIKCPPIIVPFKFNNRGIKLFQKQDHETGTNEMITHVLDHVGKNYQVADMIEEVRACGLSRKSYEDFPFDKLTYGKSKIWLTHSEAWIDNMPHQFEVWECPKGKQDHDHTVMPQLFPESCCGGFWWQNVYGTEPLSCDELKSLPDTLQDELITKYRGITRRTLACGHSYYCSSQPDWLEPHYQEAIFLVLPITNISIPRGERSAEIAGKIRAKTDIPVWEPEA